MSSILRAEQLSKTFICGGQEFEVLRWINLEIVEGTLVALIGPSGCGKSTQVNYPRTEFGSFGVVPHAGSSQANQFDAYRQASCRSKKQLAFRMARQDKAVTFLPTTLRRGTHRNALRLRTCKRTEDNIEYLFCFVKCEEGPSDIQMNQGGCGGPFLNRIARAEQEAHG
jgi:ABC-type dipeptide/oligopeptide/nickel transport system ATPase subunit